ncbi:MAG: excinuclease ABC subunit UvrC [Rhodospirillaceae bacterium]|jgi:excinuclease ABC subunit C|nr:excinuclease ABC subunit UvrC [Rhodospirillaceae bacterium]MBT5243582.1 excinuclease ABC subunit UvrC [Rhodospirillaceae bacterium]MBT5562170.1 excinuclease ABC subunit UvrC [Rhodospirillaceae bacterium]MBT6242343.1 excinuclease ABC subunit UvrC [Rhodospirillaceae bacterium]MBT7138951.1 excinuclease ABC subunit UvrC [Rhodospirillaceae bacterium]
MAKKHTDKDKAGSSAKQADARPAGVKIIEAHLRTLDAAPGVYRMINSGGDVLYVGKAKNLNKRVASYTNLKRQPTRLLRMISETASMEFVTTHTEAEALLLEANLIKRYKPRYNILLRDDKSFPKILLTSGHPFVQVMKHRGAESRKGEYFGPFASVWAVNETLTILQRAFFLRTCSDSVFENRTRPCLLYQIKRCSAPCVDRIDTAGYAELVSQARAFLTGESQKIQRDLAGRMQKASDEQDYETAAGFRDRIRALTRVQAHQDINFSGVDEADVIAAHQAGGHTCVEVFFFRGGRNFGNRAYYPSHAKDENEAQVLEAFIGQFYDNKEPPRLLLLSHRLPNQALIADALGVKSERKVSVVCPQRGEKLNLVEHALNNAREALGRRLSESASQRRLLEGLAEVLDLDAAPERIEVYDNSHISGTKAIGGMIVAGPEGMIKNAYRKFTIKNPDTAPGDDYAMMREVLTRRFSRALKEDPERSRGQWPDLVLIDGGAGQLSVTLDVLKELEIDDVVVAGIAKGVDRNAGRERIFLPGREPISLAPRDPVLYFLQRLRDEAHRFAIGFHRQKRGKAVTKSSLDGVPGIGPRRKKALLHHFGSAPSVEGAGLADLEAVEGVSKAMAKKIYDWFHTEG